MSKHKGPNEIKRHHSGHKVPKHDPLMHADHHKANVAHGLPKDMFGHDGAQYGSGSAPCGPVEDENEASCD